MQLWLPFPEPSCRSLGFLHPGEYFGEYSCLLGQERSATVVAHTYSELYSLSRADLEVVLQQYPELAEQFESMGEQQEWCHHTVTVICALVLSASIFAAGYGLCSTDKCCLEYQTRSTV